MFASPILRALDEKPAYIDTNPYSAKRLWPPDFHTLTESDQYKLERKYRRRCKLAWARPKWNKSVQVAQLCTLTFVAVYGILIMDLPQANEPFAGLRNQFRAATGLSWGRKANAQ